MLALTFHLCVAFMYSLEALLIGVFVVFGLPYLVSLIRDEIVEFRNMKQERAQKIKEEDDSFFTELVEEFRDVRSHRRRWSWTNRV